MKFILEKIKKSKIKSKKSQYNFHKERVPIILYTSKFINIFSFIISIIIYLFINFFINNETFKANKVEFKANFVSQENLNQANNINSNSLEENNVVNLNENKEKEEWYIQIDKISLKAEIQEGTTKGVMEDYVGHFEETSKDTGNVGLAAHNRGYKNNYFSRLKELKEGDEIKYKYNGIERIYEVTKHEIIENTDWSELEETDENTITLITCVENEPNYRRCIQGIEK